MKTLLERIQNKNIVVGIMGLGYVGLPLARSFVDKGVRVVGFDIDAQKVDALLQKRSYIRSVDESTVGRMVESGLFDATSDMCRLRETDAILMCVPTPLTKNREPDMSYVESTVHIVSEHVRPNQLIVLESTTYPGTTRELISPLFEAKGFVLGENIFVAYSPEREDPGNPQFATHDIPKVVGADDEVSLALAQALYQTVVPSVVTVSSSATAEAVKLMENIFRSVNIALVNELKTVFSPMGIDVWEVIHAAKTKPFGFMPFYPGPGLGGHCIPIDPFYLTWKAREFDVTTKFIELAGEVNTAMPQYVIDRVRDALDQYAEKSLHGSRILVLGVAYKKNVDDPRESPALTIINKLLLKKVLVTFHDPYIPSIPGGRHFPHLDGLQSEPLTAEALQKADVVLVLTDHDCIDYNFVGQHARLVVDTRNAMAGVTNPKASVIKA